MNTRIYAQIKELKEILAKQYGIKKIALIGSQARDDFTPDSDVDIVIIEGKKRLLQPLSSYTISQ